MERSMGSLVAAVLFLLFFFAAGVLQPAFAGGETLSMIAIHRATMELNSSAYVKASPTLLGLKGEDTEWVTVEYGSPKPTSGDWIAVFSPAKFNASTCPADSYGKDQKPLLCTSPIKFQFANFSMNYIKSGMGSLKFLLINQRADFAFALFTGGLGSPKLIAVSNAITFANPKAPLYPRLAQGKAWNEMTVTWTSGYSISEATPLVEWGLKYGERMWSPAVTLTFTRDQMCGAPARTVGWRDPGFIHTGFLKELWPNAQYTYKFGNKLFNGSTIWSNKEYAFKAPPYPGQDSVQRVIVFGDLGRKERDGSDEYWNTNPGSLNTTDRLIQDLDNMDIVFHIGDISYANGYLSEWDQFTAQVQPITSRVPYMIGSGNHERDWPDTGSFYATTDSGGECGVAAENMYYVPTENKDKFWYSTSYGMFHFCIGDTEQDWRIGSEQHKFIEQCLASVDRQRQPWLIFAAHRVLGYSSASDYELEGSFAEPMGRESLQLLWQKYKVDIAFFGHVHQYERTCPVYENQCVNSETSHFTGPLNGTIHSIVGGGGKSLDDFTTAVPQWSIFRDKDFGFVKLTAFNHSSLLYEYKRSRDGKVHDSFTITRDYRDILACVHDACPPTTLAS